MERFKLRLCLLVFVLVASLVGGKTIHAAAAIKITGEETAVFVNNFTARHVGEYDGVAIVVVQDNEIIFSKGYGVADQAGTRPVDPAQTIYNASSVGKLFTATAVMQLVEQGLVDLDADVNQYLTGFTVESDPPVTLRHLLTHTGGVESSFLGAEVYHPEDIISMSEFFKQRPPVVNMTPGTAISYSNHGMALAGHIVETVTGQAYDDYLTQNIFTPLKMNYSAAREPLPANLLPYAAYHPFNDEILLLYPAGGLYTSAEDMAHFMLAHLNDGQGEFGQLLQPQTVAQMQQQQFTNYPDVPGVGLGFFELYYNGQRGLFHTGLRGHSSLFFMLPEQRLGFYLVGDIPEGSSFKKDFLIAFLDRFFPEDATSELAPPPDFLEDADRYTGFYRLTNVPLSNVEKIMGLGLEGLILRSKDGPLQLRLPPIPFSDPISLIEVEPNLFRAEADPTIYVAFREDEEGKMEHLFYGSLISDPLSFTVIPWYESGLFNIALAGLGGLTFASFILFSLLGFFWRKGRRHTIKPLPSEAQWAWRWAGLVSLLAIVGSAILIIWLIANNGPRLDGVPPVFYVVTGSVSLAGVFGLALPVFAFRAWQQGFWSFSRRLYFSWVAVTAVIMLVFLNYWTIFGFQF